MNLKAVLKQLKFGQVIPPQIKNNGALAGNTYFDTLGLSAVLFLLEIGATDVVIGSTDTSTPLFLEECDTSGGNYTKVADSELAAVIADNGDSKLRAVAVDLTKTHKRFIRWNAPTAGNSTGANLSSIAIGFPSDVLPSSAAQQGLEELVEA
ncbi:MAG: hypothetical protein A2Y12_06140 [Planctomycetes bacterium GWF2_42_9]|nr:MAG: hypothetical protein A2Y12_06140 [Planctomycetes bacterium GWF2_42_9]HAL45689.1 hypothetical protein [Phycisphaerales bacterium]